MIIVLTCVALSVVTFALIFSKINKIEKENQKLRGETIKAVRDIHASMHDLVFHLDLTNQKMVAQNSAIQLISDYIKAADQDFNLIQNDQLTLEETFEELWEKIIILLRRTDLPPSYIEAVADDSDEPNDWDI